MENFFGSSGSLIVAVDFGRTVPIVRGSLNRCAVEFFLFPLNGSPIGGSSERICAASKEDYASRIDSSIGDDLRGVSGRRAHFNGTVLGVGSIVRRVLLNVALYIGSLRSPKKILTTETSATTKIICAGYLGA